MLSWCRGLSTWEAQRLIRNTLRPSGELWEPWSTAAGAVSLRLTTLLSFFSFSSFFVVVAVWVLAAGTVGTPLIHVGVLHGIDRPWSRPGSAIIHQPSAIISRGSSVTQRGRESALHHSTAAPLHHRALPAKGGGSLQAAQMTPSSTSTRVRRARHPNLQLRQQQHIASRSPHATGRVRSVPEMGLAHRCHGRPRPVHERLHLPVEPASRPLIDPGILVFLFSSPGRTPNIVKKNLVCGV